MVVFGGVDFAGAEQDGEQGQQQGRIQRRVGQHAAAAVRGRTRQHVDAHRHCLELQGDVGDGGDHRDQRDGGGDVLGAAVARGQEVGDGHRALFARHQHQAFEDAPAEQEQQDRPQVDRQEAQAGGRRRADRPVEGPGRAVHRQRQGIDDRPQPVAARVQRLAVAQPGHAEQQPDVADRHQQQDPACNHGPSPGEPADRPSVAPAATCRLRPKS